MSALDGKTAVVTGASRGIGRAVAEQLTSAGTHTVRLARTVKPDSKGGRLASVRCDVRDADEVAAAARRIVDALGPPDILVHSAGSFLLRPFAETSADDFRDQVETNLLGAFHVLRSFVPEMAARGGHVVTIGSVADETAFPENAAYAASKFGLRGLHRVLAAEYGTRQLRWTLVSPGPTNTALWDPVDPDRRTDLPDRSAMLRPDDVAAAVLFAVTRPAHVVINAIRLGPA